MFSFQDTDKFKLFEENYGNFRKIDFLCTISICFTFFVFFVTDYSFLVCFEEEKEHCVYFVKENMQKISANFFEFLFFLEKKIEKNYFFLEFTTFINFLEAN